MPSEPAFYHPDAPIGIRERTRFVLSVKLDDGTRVWFTRVTVVEECRPDGVWNSGTWVPISHQRLDAH